MLVNCNVRIGHMLANGLGGVKSCPAAVAIFKSVAERGDALAPLKLAHQLFEEGSWFDTI
jgi:TPR repeat protein